MHLRLRRVRPATLLHLAILLVLGCAAGEPLPALVDQAKSQAPLTGTVVVVNKQGNSASFIDLASRRIVATLPTGRGPHELAMASHGRTAVVTDYSGGNSLTVLDVPSASVVRTVDLSAYPRPHGIQFLPGDTVVAVTSETAGAVVLVRVADGVVVRDMGTEAGGSHMLAATADGVTIWTGDMSSNTVTELEVRTGRRVRALAAPQRPEAVMVTPDGARVFAGSNDTGRITAWDTSTGSATTVAEGFQWPYRIFLTPGVEQILVPDLRAETLRFFSGEDYRELGALPFPGEAPQGLTLHPDGRHLFLSLSSAERIAVVDIVTRQVVGYLPAGAGPDGIGYSPVIVGR